MWRPLLISATLAFIILSSAAHSLPLLRNTSLALTPFNITSPTPEAPLETANLTYYPWPNQPYGIVLHGSGLLFPDAFLIIGGVWSFQSSPMVSVPDLRHFIQDFADNIQREYPVPGFVPSYATQSIIDISSYTKWTIKISEGMFHGRLPTAVALAALDELGEQLSRYGPATVFWLIHKNVRMTLPWASGHLDIENIEGISLNESSLKENDGFQTA